jgi:pyruvate dehydrogenase phosphatase
MTVMVTPEVNDKWKVEPLTTIQNGDNDSEVERVRHEHPGEDQCVLDRRVLGALAPTRCMSLVSISTLHV